MIITILQIHDSTHHISGVIQNTPYKQNIWFWIALAEATVIFLLISLKYKKKIKGFDEQLIIDSKNSDIDMGNVLNSIYQSKELYDQLKVKCHPDKFLNVELNQLADKLFQEITKNKRNYKKLLELKAVAENELNIKI